MADTKISALTDATSVGGTDELAIVQSATTKRATAAEFKTYIEGNLAADTIDTITEIAAALKSGADGTLITGTAGTSGTPAEWNADGDVIDATSTYKVAGKETIWIPATAMTPATTSGAATGQIETSTHKLNFETLDFDSTADEYACFTMAMPKQWNLGTVTFQAFWSATTGGTTGVAVGLQAVAIGDNVTSDTAYGTGVVVTDDAQTGALEVYVSAESGAVTIGNTPADDEIVNFRVYRDVSDANDDLAEDMHLIGIKLFITTDAKDDT